LTTRRLPSPRACRNAARAQNEVESVRLKTDLYEMIISQHGNFTLVVIQMEEPAAVALEAAEVVEGAEGEKKEA
jgi:hypothetical protein